VVSRILRDVPQPIWVVDAAGRISFANPAAVTALGYSDQAEFLGKESHATVHYQPPGRPAGDGCVLLAPRLTGHAAHGEDEFFVRRDGSLFPIAWWSSPIDLPSGRGVVVAFTDITERREAQEALERSNAELAQFAYVASHDLSEPLRMVSSYLQLLRRRYRGQIDEDADEFIDFAVEGANRMRALIEDLLAYSRAGRSAEPRPVDCGYVMADVLSSLAAAVADARAQVSVGPLPTVLGDRVAIAQLLQNLVANALKFRHGPGVCVWVNAEEHDGMWEFAVSDDGIGIDPRHRERVFKMFQRLHDRESFEGTGIGLAICRKIVERQGGRIWVEGRDGGGTVFRFTLPAVPKPALVEPGAPARGGAALPA
jgi:PAS domain S-box-containing protein